jgi:hypothetical protein
MMLPFSIPRTQHESLKYLSQLDENIFEKFRTALETAKPCATLAELYRQFSLGDESARGLPNVIANIFGLRGLIDTAPFPVTAADLAAHVADQARKGVVDDDAAAERLKERLKQLLSLNSVILTGKAIQLVSEHQHPVEELRIVTDVRPLFIETETDGTPAVKASLVLHTLRIEDSAGDSFFFAFTEADLITLQKVIDRAQAKAKVLKQALGNTTLDCVSISTPTPL